MPTVMDESVPGVRDSKSIHDEKQKNERCSNTSPCQYNGSKSSFCASFGTIL